MPVPRQFPSDAARDATPRDRWGLGEWVDYVETGATQTIRAQRHRQAPGVFQPDITRICNRRNELRAAETKAKDPQ